MTLERRPGNEEGNERKMTMIKKREKKDKDATNANYLPDKPQNYVRALLNDVLST